MREERHRARGRERGRGEEKADSYLEHDSILLLWFLHHTHVAPHGDSQFSPNRSRESDLFSLHPHPHRGVSEAFKAAPLVQDAHQIVL